MMNTTESKEFRSRRQVWVGVVAALFVCDFVWCGYLPSQKRLKSLRESRAQQQRTIQMADAQGPELPKLRARLRDTQKTVEQYETCVPAESSLGTFLQQIAGTMTKHHLVDQVVVPGKEWESDSFNGIPIHMTCTGALTNIFQFFTDLHALGRLVRVEKVVLKNDSAFTGQVNMDVNAVIFYQSSKQRKSGISTDSRSAGVTGHGA